MKEIKAIIQPFMLDEVCDALGRVPDLPGLTVSHVRGFGRRRDVEGLIRNGSGEHSFADRSKIEVVVPDAMVSVVLETIASAARTGKPGDGKVFVLDVCDAVKIRTGDRGEAAI